MAWTIKFTIQAAKQFQALDKPIRQRIQKFLAHRLAHLDDPRTLGKPLQGPLSNSDDCRFCPPIAKCTVI